MISQTEVGRETGEQDMNMRTTKGLQGRTPLFELDDGET